MRDTMELPKIVKEHGRARLLVDGRPFLILGVQWDCDGCFSPEEMNPLFPHAARLGANTVTLPTYWREVEPEPGRYDFTMIDERIRVARENGLRIVETLLTSSTRFIANRQAMDNPWKRQKIENIALLLQGAIAAREKVGLKMNVARKDLAAITAILPAEKSPTVSALADPQWVAIEVIVEERVERELVPQLKRAGATGIITYPLNKVIP